SKASSRSSSSSSAKAKAAREAGPLTREEKAAKKRNALFKDSRDWDEPESSGGMALARAMKEAGRPSSSYSSATRAPAPKPLPKPPSANSATIKSSKHLNGSAKLSAPRPASPANGASARDRLKAGFDPTQFVKLNTAKRDLRTIEEIERDMKLKKSGVDPSSVSRTSGSTVASTSTSKSLLPKNGTSHSSSSTMQKRKPGDGRDQTQNSKRPRMDDRTTSSSRSRRDRSSSRSEESEYESSSEDDWDRRRGRKEKSGLGDSMRSEIWKIMGRDRQRDMAMTTYSDDESDMEATGADLWREEQRAERLAKKEDEEEQERLRIRAEEKRKRKALKG
ncbi:chromatin SPT2 family protein, partial [Pseudohyphozyma bogoriensis]